MEQARMKKHKLLRSSMAVGSLLFCATLLWQIIPQSGNSSAHAATRNSTFPPTVVHATFASGALADYALHAVAFANNRNGWVVGNGVILSTTDGGLHFAAQYHGPLDLVGVQALNANHAVAYSRNAILVTKNGGCAWSVVRQSGPALIQAHFTSPTTGFAVRGARESFAGSLFRTTDGGRVWRPVRGVTGVTSVTFSGSSVGWAGDGNTVYHTTDGGAVWTKSARLPGLPGYAHLQATDIHHVWMQLVGGSGMSQTSYSILASTDGVHFKPVLGVSTAGAGPAPGGATHANRGPGSSPGPFVAVNNNIAYAAGECEACGAGTITLAKTTDGGLHWTQYPPIPDVPGLPNAVGASSTMSFPSPADGWLLGNLVGVSNRLYHTTDGGRSWFQAYPAIMPADGFSLVNSAVGFGLGVAGNANAVLETTDGGGVWRIVGHLPVASAPPFNGGVSEPMTIQFVSAKRGFAVGSNSLLYGTVDGGRSWRLIPLGLHPTAFMYSSLWFANASSGMFAVDQGMSNRVTDYVTTNGGVTWRKMQAASLQAAQLAITPPALARSAVARMRDSGAQSLGTSGTDIAWVTTSYGFYLTTSGGRSWTPVDFPPNVAFQPDIIQFTSAKDGFVQFLDGNIYRTVDGGRRWTLIAT